MTKIKKIKMFKKYLCVVCGKIFIDLEPNTMVCNKCKKDLCELSNEMKEVLNHDTDKSKN